MGKQKYKSFKVFLNRHLCLSKGRICGIVAAVTISLSLLQFSAKQTSFQKSRGPPPTFQVQPKYASYTKVPEKSRRTYYVDTHTKYKATAIRALRNIGWRRTNDYETAQLIWDKTMDSEYFSELKAWQRYNHIPGVESWDDKDNFIEGFEQYLRKNPEKKFMMLPETYKISTQQGIRDWRKRLFQHSGMDIPWVLKQTDVNNGEGIDILGPNSKELKDVERDLDHQNATEDGTYVVQAYICNELTWWGNFKFDLRYYWLVASLDPLVVLYHDGFVRVGNSAYSESDFSSTTKHLTTHTYLPDEIKAPADDLARLIRQHYQKNYRKLSKTIKIDPYEHVRNQLKEAVAETVAAFKHVTFRTDTKDGKFTAENGFVIYGIDFVVDNDLNAWYTESQEGPGWEEEFDFRITLHKDLLESAFRIVEEIQNKVESNPSANVLPLQNQAGWDIVYAGNGEHHWMYHYSGYNRPMKANKCMR